MKNETNVVINLGDANLSQEQAIKLALEKTVAEFPRDQHSYLDPVKEFVLQEGKYVSKVVKFWAKRSSQTSEIIIISMIFLSLRRTKARGWEFEIHRSFSLGDNNNPDVDKKLISFLSSMNSLDTSGEVMVFSADTINIEKLSEIIKIVLGSGQQIALLSKIFDWTQSDSHSLAHLTQLSSDDSHRSQSLVAALNYGRYRAALIRFEEMVEDNLPEHDYQKFLQENYWLFGSEYSELLDTRNLVVRQQLDFPLRRTVDGYFEVIEIKKPLDGNSGFYCDKSHKTYYPGSEVLLGTSQVLNYLASLETHRNDILVENKIDVTRVRGKLIIGSDGCEKEKRARRLFNENSVSVEVISFDGLIQIGQRILDIMVAENPTLRDIHSQRAESDENDVGEIPF